MALIKLFQRAMLNQIPSCVIGTGRKDMSQQIECRSRGSLGTLHRYWNFWRFGLTAHFREYSRGVFSFRGESHDVTIDLFWMHPQRYFDQVITPSTSFPLFKTSFGELRKTFDAGVLVHEPSQRVFIWGAKDGIGTCKND